MKITLAISVVAIFGLVGFMTDPVWEAMALWQRQVWILTMSSAFLALMALFFMYYSGMSKPTKILFGLCCVKRTRISITLLLYKLLICVYNSNQYLETFNSPQKKTSPR